MSCIQRILELKGNKEFLHVKDPEKNILNFKSGLTVEGGAEYKGFHYLIVFIGRGHRCGYVALPSDHVLSDKELQLDLQYKSAPYPYSDGLSVHGGISFHEQGTHITELLFPNEIICADIWIGFDAMHFNDAIDLEAHEKYYGKESTNKLKDFFKKNSNFTTVKTYQFMENECKRLIDQL